jgi:predicted GH43/DUF377 family glycosyl hydrolase
MPTASWETLKIGGGTPPVLTKHGWMIVYHGVSEIPATKPGVRKLSYSAGVMILDRDNPLKVLYRSPEPVLNPWEHDERIGEVAHVVFPTGIDCRSDIGHPNRFDVYYGMADDKVGVARMVVPEALPGRGV